MRELGELKIQTRVQRQDDFMDKSTRVIRKVRKIQHQNPEFGHTHGEIKKRPCKKVH
jgi:hypothetical protein